MSESPKEIDDETIELLNTKQQELQTLINVFLDMTFRDEKLAGKLTLGDCAMFMFNATVSSLFDQVRSVIDDNEKMKECFTEVLNKTPDIIKDHQEFLLGPDVLGKLNQALTED